MTLDNLNTLDQQAFTSTLADIFEHSPWVAKNTWPTRPFSSVDTLHHAMTQAMYEANEQQQLDLICAHPDLAGKAARLGEVTDSSKQEQAGAGLDQLSDDEFARFHDLNTRYKTKFGFPFILAVKGHTKTSILAAFETRLNNSQADEHQTALAEITKIARFRLEALLTSSS
ncbi:MAG: 2-oxo-4-hydroxy-4-carboxy-5-ureidoimidazoline decarboxylase [Deinococcota bacterium]